MPRSTDVVVLIPGFLGFEQIGGFYYFADRVGAAMRAILTDRRPGGVPVVPVTTLPSDHLHRRQSRLLASLAGIAGNFPDAERLHLVGHSTGGTDALLLLGEEPVARRRSWDRLDPTGVRAMIRTIVSIASPHHGSCVTMGRLARFLRRPLINFHAAGSAVRGAVLMAAAVSMDAMARRLISGAFWDQNAAKRYIVEALSARGLVDDLRPNEMSKLHERFRPDFSDVCFRSVVTLAAKRTEHYPGAEGPEREPDELFEYLYLQTAGEGGFCGIENRQLIEDAEQRLRLAMAEEDLLISNPSAERRELTPRLNDGIVNSVRQLYDPDNDDELCAIVVGDHFDVLGYYPYWVGLDKSGRPEPVQTGILHSGSGFADGQFFELYRRIARVIGEQLED